MTTDEPKEVVFQVQEGGKIKLTTEKEIWEKIKERKEKLVKDLEDCIDNQKPFLLIVSTSKELKVENLRTTTGLNSSQFVHALTPIFLGLSYPMANEIIKALSEIMLLNLIENICRDYLDRELLSLAVSTGCARNQYMG